MKYFGLSRRALKFSGEPTRRHFKPNTSRWEAADLLQRADVNSPQSN